MYRNLINLINEPYNDMNNFNLAYEYDNIDQTAAALSYYLRCAEFTKNKDLAYECMLRMSKCLNKQGNRDYKELACIKHAFSIYPNRPEVNYILSLYHSYRNNWLDSYMYACIGLENIDKQYKPLIKDIGYLGIYQLLYQKAFAGYNKGKIYESKRIFCELLYYYPNLDENYKKIIIQNLSVIPKKLQKIYFKELDDKKNDICICSLSDREWLYSQTIPTIKLYAEKYNCKFYLHKDIIDESRHPAWSKLLLVYNLLKLNRYEYVVWIDDDILLTDLNKDIREFIISDKNIILSSEYKNSSSAINTGFVFYKNNIETLNILENVYKNGENNVHMYESPWEQALMLDYYNNNKNDFEILPYRKLQSHICKCEDKEKQILHWKYGDFSAHCVTSDFDIQKDKKIRLKSISEIKTILKNNENINNKNKTKLNLIFFGNELFNKQKIRLKNEALKTKWFDNIYIETPDTINHFITEHSEIFKYKRGFGYWLWKPYIILRKLMELNENDILVYIDSGSTIINNKKEKDRYLDILKKKSIITFANKDHIEEKFQKKTVLEYFNLENNKKFLNSQQIESGCIIIKNNNISRLFITEWLELCKFNNYKLLIDITENEKNNQNNIFIEHRHDQSILSILSKKSKYSDIVYIFDNYELYRGNTEVYDGHYSCFFSSRLIDGNDSRKYSKKLIMK